MRRRLLGPEALSGNCLGQGGSETAVLHSQSGYLSYLYYFARYQPSSPHGEQGEDEVYGMDEGKEFVVEFVCRIHSYASIAAFRRFL